MSAMHLCPKRGLGSIALLAAVCLGGLTGCGSGKADVKGVVTYQGKVVRSGGVVMVGEDNVPISAGIDEDGRYFMRGVPTGPVRVAVMSPNPGAPGVSRPRTHTRPDEKSGSRTPLAPGQTRDASKWFALPDRYESVDTSEIATRIEPGENLLNIDLK